MYRADLLKQQLTGKAIDCLKNESTCILKCDNGDYHLYRPIWLQQVINQTETLSVLLLDNKLRDHYDLL